MDFESYWQENKRSVVAIIAGLLVFFIANALIDGTLGRSLRDARASRSAKLRDLRRERYTSEAKQLAQADNERLAAAREALVSAVVFVPRPEFRFDAGRGSVAAQFFTRVEEVRARLSRRAGRSGLRPPDDAWGIEMPETNAEPVLVRHMEALDLIERVVDLAVETGVSHISRIQVELDPAFGSKKGLGAIERTRVLFDLDTSSTSVASLVVLAQTPAQNESTTALPLDGLEIRGDRNRPGWVKASLTFTIVRLTGEGSRVDAEEVTR